MAWWGKVIGGAFGFALGGPLGAVLGAALGHPFDTGLSSQLRGGMAAQERTQAAFFTALFSVMGHIAKVDGQVSAQEIRMAEALMAHMKLSPEQKRAAIELFNRGKAADFPLGEVLEQFRRECRRHRTLLQFFIEAQVEAALADGRVDAAELRVLRHLCRELGLDEGLIAPWIDAARASKTFDERFHRADDRGAGRTAGKRPVAAAFEVLGVAQTASNAEIKKAYRRLMSQHHPDKLVAKGLPEEMQQMATEKTQEISAAYQSIREVRGF
ncbi:MAG: co-chaperone DjlA [Pseudomonadota bacterium]|nr:co-chaperone DjlA [Pseudomonadota bacterium]